MKPRVLFVLKYREQPYDAGAKDWSYSGSGKPLCSGLFNSANMACEMLKRLGYASEIVHVRDGNDIHRECVKFKADVCIIEAFWCPPYKFGDLIKALPKTRFIVRNHSETPFLSSEGIAFGWMKEYAGFPNVLIAPNSMRMFGDTRAMGISSDRLRYLPNYYSHDKKAVKASKWAHLGELNVGCFGAVRPLKNVIIQALAAIQFARDNDVHLRFHINGNRVEGNGGPILKNVRSIFQGAGDAIELVEHNWMDSEDFRGLIGTMDLVTQVSLSETFNIVLADAVFAGVPVIGSAEVPWLVNCCAARPNSRPDIERKIYKALGFWSKRLVKRNQANIERHNAESMAQWNKVLLSL
ncbi:hypothetical protein [Rhizobium sp. RCAM05973]|uniref:hypothetical protein n=1 Tax=Rhizobium sp. RCAM05973 TaxID=2994066 RepID=UPI0022EBAADC|nr:hypothetical protein [Rhizobium sp. RCAM05973]